LAIARDLASWRTTLPIGDALPALETALARSGAAVLCAPPGAGKTTLVPLVLLDAAWLAGQRIVMLEPRRLAARAAARRMAEMLGESVGATVGYRTRLDTQASAATRVEVVTEGVLPRFLQDDPALEGVGLLIFDEFHERSLEADLALALALETRRHLREDLRLLVMSATLEAEAVARLLGDAPVIAGAGRGFPVAVRHLKRPPPERIEAAVAQTVHLALAEEQGSLLAFLPGGAEIRRVEHQLAREVPGRDVIIAPLYGDLPQAAQVEAIRPAPAGRRKVVLATPIAETSLTIEGIRVVIDSGLMRVPRFEPRSSMTRLATVRVSQASAEQRRGRAGRLAPGVCYRLWPESEQSRLRPFNLPEILQADLAPLALALARCGDHDPAALAWLDPPPAAAYAQARRLLHELGSLDASGRITAHGHEMAMLGLHPRLAHMMLVAASRGLGRLAAAIAALLGERDILKAAHGARDADLGWRVELLSKPEALHSLSCGTSVDLGAVERVRQSARDLERRLRLRASEPLNADAAGRVLALAYPDRIAQRRPGGDGQFRLSNGRGAALPPTDPLAAAEYLAVADLDGAQRVARIFLAARLSRGNIEEDFAQNIERQEFVGWDGRQEAVLSRQQTRLGALVLADEPLAEPQGERVQAAMLEGIRALGLKALPWTREAEGLRLRILFLRRLEGEAWPDLSDLALLATLDAWLGPHLSGITRRPQLDRLDLAALLRQRLSPQRQHALDRLAPSHIGLSRGSRLPVDYGAGEIPVLAVRLQELYGTSETPSIAGGRVKLVLHLLSPAGRPLQVTRDLAAFWSGGYPAVRREMRGRYPKHSWPEDPLTALPIAGTKRPAR
jgi:ATP-dependent helicase HrpB